MTLLPAHLVGPRILALSSGRLLLGIAPDLGGSIVYFAEQRDEGLRHWFRPADAAAMASGSGHHAACFPLVPVSGRIADAQLRWRGQTIAVPRNVTFEPNHLHGDGWQRPWRIAQSGRHSAILALDAPVSDWPFPYSACYSYALDPFGLTIKMSVRNEGNAAMPAAIGVHPWFPAPLADLEARADRLWQIDARKLFSAVTAPDERRRFDPARSLVGTDLEHGLTGWDGRATISWPGRPGRLIMLAAPPLDHLVIYTREPSGDFCVEPVSCSVDAFNLADRGIEGTGTTVLEAGETLAGTARFQIE